MYIYIYNIHIITYTYAAYTPLNQPPAQRDSSSSIIIFRDALALGSQTNALSDNGGSVLQSHLPLQDDSQSLRIT